MAIRPRSRTRSRAALPLFALLLFPAAAPAPAAGQGGGGEGETVDRHAVNRAIDRGVAWLVRRQEIDGSWRYKQDEYPAGQTALSLYTLLESGVAREHHAVRRALAYLRTAPDGRTYSRACLSLALAAHDPATHRDWIASLAEGLLAGQIQGFAYPHGDMDLSNTQYAALGLAAAAGAGVEVPSRAWQRMAEFAVTAQSSDGGFGYKAAHAPTGSMTAAGLTVITLCERALAGSSTPQLRSLLSSSRRRGLEWLAANFSATGNPEPANPQRQHDRWEHYYLYGLERVGALAGVESIGGHDWYAEGARHLLARQGGEGDWGTPYGEQEPNTCFALLFLERATGPSTGWRENPPKVYADDGPHLDVGLRASGDTPLALWISSFGDALRARAEWPGEEGRGPRVARVTYLADGEPVATAEGNPGGPAERERFAVQHRFETPGTHRVSARVEIALPDGGLEIVASPELAVEIDHVLPEWMLAYADDRRWNLLRDARFDASATSERNGDWRAAFAADGLQSRGWLAAPEEATPTLVLDFKRPVRADTILLSHARQAPTDPGAFARASAVEVRLNRRPPERFALQTDERRKAEVRLARAERILRLEIRILERVEGRNAERAVGFQELELQDSREVVRDWLRPGAK